MSILCAFHNGLGNALIATSVWQALASLSDNNQVDLILDSVHKEAPTIALMAEKMPFVRRVIFYPEDFEEYEYDKVYASFHGVFHSPLAERIHGRERLKPEHYNCWAASFHHEIDHYYQEIRKQFGYKGKIYPQFMSIADKLPLKLPSGLKFVFANGYARTSDDAWKRKTWPYFDELANAILCFYPGASIYLIGSEEDREWAESVIQNVGVRANIYQLAGKLNILESARLISECDFGIYSDSVCFHAADALRKPGVALFGSTLVSKNAPLNGTVIPIRSSLACAPCQATTSFNACAEPHKCMAAIPVGQVFAAIRKFLLT